jgi:hypothetical protein
LAPPFGTLNQGYATQHPGSLDKHLAEFGYGTKGVSVHHYWDEAPVLAAQPEQVKWLVLANASRKSLLVVLASWSAEKTTAKLSLDGKALVFPEREPARSMPKAARRSLRP